MKKTVFALALASAATFAHADPGVMIGVNYSFSAGLGFSVKVLSSDRENRTVATLGTSYYPRSNNFGVDVGVGRTFENGVATVGWDVINSEPQFSLGYVDTVR